MYNGEEEEGYTYEGLDRQLDRAASRHHRRSTAKDTGVIVIDRDRLVSRLHLSRGAQERLARRARAGDRRARDELVRTNLRLVVSIAKKYRGEGMSFEDLVSEGVVGLIRAIHRFDADKGYRLSTYATFWIRKVVLEAWADQGRTVRLPRAVHEDLQRLSASREELSSSIGRTPSAAELARALECSREHVEELSRLRQYTFSLDVPAGATGTREGDGDGGGRRSVLEELVGDAEQSEEPAEEAARSVEREALAGALARIPSVDRTVLVARYGLDGAEPRTSKEIADTWGGSREWVRQCQLRAESRLANEIDKEPRSHYREAG